MRLLALACGPRCTKVQGRPWRFTLRALFFVILVAACLESLFQPGRLISGNVDVTWQFVRFAYGGERGLESSSLFAVMRATNLSGNSVWYRGTAPEHPNTVWLSLVQEKWQYEATSYEPTGSYVLYSGESRLLWFPVREQATACKFGVAFASRWWGATDQLSLSDEVKISSSVVPIIPAPEK